MIQTADPHGLRTEPVWVGGVKGEWVDVGSYAVLLPLVLEVPYQRQHHQASDVMQLQQQQRVAIPTAGLCSLQGEQGRRAK